jgi:hypothetical protein
MGAFGGDMRTRWTLIALLALTPLAIAPSCSTADKFRNQRDLLGVVELGPFPKQAAGVGGYNLYFSQKPDGPFEKINQEPVLGGTRLMVPMLNPGQDYYFRMTSVSARDNNKESAPGQVFKRTAATKN